MPKSKREKKNSLFPSGLTPHGFMAKQATGDGRKTNKTKNIKRFFNGE
jgi:hypothetical protein